MPAHVERRMGGTPFVFLDRDGTLVREVNYGHRLEDYELLAGVPAALRRLADAGYGLAIVTNQSGIGRGFFTQEDFERFQRRLLADLGAAGVRIATTYFCPHHPDEACECRKPLPALLHRARDELGADLGRSWVIGDHVKDIELAANAGCRGAVLVRTGHGAEQSERLGSIRVAGVADDLGDAATIILGR
jgi:D-glycero-D-manno-heptose 1,7-bisphosphate phosphatase